MFCSKCGQKIESGAAFCSKCGASIESTNQQAVIYYTPKVPGNGLSIAGMVLGIIGLAFAFLYLISFASSDYVLRYNRVYGGYVIAYAFGVILIPLALSATGLPLSICGMLKNKNGKNISGIILNSITLVIQLILFLYIVINYS